MFNIVFDLGIQDHGTYVARLELPPTYHRYFLTAFSISICLEKHSSFLNYVFIIKGTSVLGAHLRRKRRRDHTKNAELNRASDFQQDEVGN